MASLLVLNLTKRDNGPLARPHQCGLDQVRRLQFLVPQPAQGDFSQICLCSPSVELSPHWNRLPRAVFTSCVDEALSDRGYGGLGSAGQGLDWMSLKVFSNVVDSMIQLPSPFPSLRTEHSWLPCSDQSFAMERTSTAVFKLVFSN